MKNLQILVFHDQSDFGLSIKALMQGVKDGEFQGMDILPSLPTLAKRIEIYDVMQPAGSFFAQQLGVGIVPVIYYSILENGRPEVFRTQTNNFNLNQVLNNIYDLEDYLVKGKQPITSTNNNKILIPIGIGLAILLLASRN